MVDRIKRALTRKEIEKEVLDLEPGKKLIFILMFGMSIIICLTTIEIASMALLHTWNAEVFATISGISGVVIGILVGRKP